MEKYSTEIDLHMYGSLIFYKGTEAIQRREDSVFQKIV